MSTTYMSTIKKLGVELHNQKASKSALLGVEGLKNVLLQAYRAFTGDKNIRTFDDEEEAKNWLAE